MTEPRTSPTILHLDLDTFFVSVERLHDPSLMGQPVLVGGKPEARGVVASASYETRAFGCHSAMPMARALQLCPQAIRVGAHHERYQHYSKRVMALLEEVTPLMEPMSVDEAYLDVAGCELRFGEPLVIAQWLQREIQARLGLPSSLGLATNRLLAKIASGDAKPAGICVVLPGTEAAYLAPRPIEDLAGIGPATAQKLHRWGVQRIGQLAEMDEATLVQLFGHKQGEALARHARGLASDVISPDTEAKSFSHENTFPQDVRACAVVERELLAQAEHLAQRLRTKHLQARTVTLKLRHTTFETLTRSVTLRTPTDLAQPLYEAARELLRREWTATTAVRLIGLGVSGLCEGGVRQLDLFGSASTPRQEKLAATLDALRERFGEDVIKRAALLEDEEGSAEG